MKGAVKMNIKEIKEIVLDVIYNWAPVKRVEFICPISLYGIDQDGYEQYVTAVKIALSETAYRYHWVVVSETDIEYYDIGKPPKMPQDWSYIRSFSFF